MGTFQIARRYRRIFDSAFSASFSNFIRSGSGLAAFVFRIDRIPDSQCRRHFRVLHSYGLYPQRPARIQYRHIPGHFNPDPGGIHASGRADDLFIIHLTL